MPPSDHDLRATLARIEAKTASTHELLKDHVERDERFQDRVEERASELARQLARHDERLQGLTRRLDSHDDAIEKIEDKAENTGRNIIALDERTAAKHEHAANRRSLPPWWTSKSWRFVYYALGTLLAGALGWLLHHFGLH